MQMFLTSWLLNSAAMAANKQLPAKADGGHSKTILSRNNGGNQKEALQVPRKNLASRWGGWKTKIDLCSPFIISWLGSSL